MTGHSIIRPKRPAGIGWVRRRVVLPTEFDTEAWHFAGRQLYVISAVEVADGLLAAAGDPIPQYHLSVSKSTPLGPARCSLEEAHWVLDQFGVPEALEDNHGPLIRSFWRPVADQYAGVDCSCKDNEAAIVDGDFEWRPLTSENARRAEPQR
ncbi:MAG: hypothetical protein M0Q49_02425 [Porticoccaceae bacterium]|jgi:hypothetical protein|nr:hypothetical protein [Porticoccaceae bacterium]